MISRLRAHLSENFPFLADKNLLLAVSGGLDSMVLADLFLKIGLNIAIAHCNFKLRGEESDADQKFVEAFAKTNTIPFFTTQLDTNAFAQDFRLSVQVAARKLRYNWFYELANEHHFDYILTAHHADDNLETFLINLSRGTGLEGLTGIPSQNDKVIRPILPFSRVEIAEYAVDNNIEWREDSSNSSDKYLRNKLRHHIVPALKELNPNFLNSFHDTLNYLEQTQSMADDASRIVYRKVVFDEENSKKIDLNELLQLPNYKSYLYQWLKPFGFSAWDDIYNLVHSQSGKYVFSDAFRLLKDRETLILSPKNSVNEKEEYHIERTDSEVKIPLKMTFCKVDDISEPSNTTIFVNADLLHFPLTMRKWEEGDHFQPIGMKGQSKKVSKFFKDEKFSLHEKEAIWLLCSQEKIVWIVGKRADERFKVTNTTHTILQISLPS